MGQDQGNLPYSFYGIGEIIPRVSALNRAMGTSGIALRDPLQINLMNPASYTAINYPITSIFETGAELQLTNLTSDAQDETTTDGGLAGINLWFRYSPKWAGVFGLFRYSNVSYNISRIDNLNGLVEDTEVNYIGNGGLNQFLMGHSVSLTKNLSLGFNVSYTFGSIDRTQKVSGTILFPDFEIEEKSIADNIDFDAGLQYSIPLENAILDLGITYLVSSKLEQHRSTTLFSSDTLVREDDSEDTIIPEKYGIGLAYNRRGFRINADVSYQPWTDGYLGTGLRLKDVLRSSWGVQLFGDQFDGSYLKAISWRFGFYFQKYPIELERTEFNDWGYSLGIGLPIQFNKASINLTYRHQQKGTLSNNLIKEKSSLFTLDIIIRNVWFRQNKFN